MKRKKSRSKRCKDATDLEIFKMNYDYKFRIRLDCFDGNAVIAVVMLWQATTLNSNDFNRRAEGYSHRYARYFLEAK